MMQGSNSCENDASSKVTFSECSFLVVVVRLIMATMGAVSASMNRSFEYSMACKRAMYMCMDVHGHVH